MRILKLFSWSVVLLLIFSCAGCITDNEYSGDRIPDEATQIEGISDESPSGDENPELDSQAYNATLKKTAILYLDNGYSIKILDINRKEEYTRISFRKNDYEYSTKTLFVGQTYDVKDQNDQNVVYSIYVDRIFDNSFMVELTYVLRREILLETTPLEDDLEIKVVARVYEDSITRSYGWEYDNREFWIEYEYYKDAYESYSQRSRNRDYQQFVNDPYDDELISTITTQLEDLAHEAGYGIDDIPYIATAFVQSLPYVSDSVSSGYDEYPRFPFETLFDGGGDCEDSSILLASLLYDMGYGVSLILLPDHMAVGVKGDENMPGSYYEYEGTRYYYLETTNSGWNVGVIPDEYKGTDGIVIPIYGGYPELHIEFTGSGLKDYYYTYVDLDINVENVGSASAENVMIYAYLETGDDGMVWDDFESGVIPSLDTEESVTYTVSNLKVPVGERYRAGILAWGSNAYSESVYSDWFTA
ncbi:MAG: hypothetical protein JXA98_08765 [Methanosarcinaceae archaeon]|nr:hypothetical protein [Methanosarcinaceae archaeon]